MTTKNISIQKNSVSLPSSWSGASAFISISADSIIIKKTRPLSLKSIRDKLKIVGENIKQKDIDTAIKNARKPRQ